MTVTELGCGCRMEMVDKFKIFVGEGEVVRYMVLAKELDMGTS